MPTEVLHEFRLNVLGGKGDLQILYATCIGVSIKKISLLLEIPFFLNGCSGGFINVLPGSARRSER
jgi:hypothetical protein